MYSLLREVRKQTFYDLTELKKANFNSCVINPVIIELKKASIKYYH